MTNKQEVDFFTEMVRFLEDTKLRGENLEDAINELFDEVPQDPCSCWNDIEDTYKWTRCRRSVDWSSEVEIKSFLEGLKESRENSANDVKREINRDLARATPENLKKQLDAAKKTNTDLEGNFSDIARELHYLKTETKKLNQTVMTFMCYIEELHKDFNKGIDKDVL